VTSDETDPEQGQLILASGAQKNEVARLREITELKSVGETGRELTQLIYDVTLEFLQVDCRQFLVCKDLLQLKAIVAEHLRKSC
jgi:hypothetical protein